MADEYKEKVYYTKIGTSLDEQLIKFFQIKTFIKFITCEAKVLSDDCNKSVNYQKIIQRIFPKINEFSRRLLEINSS